MKVHELQKLTDSQLIDQTNNFMKNEKESVAQFILHLAEIKRRELHLKLGYQSISEYCQEVHKLDAGQIWLRSQVATFALAFPQVISLIAKGELSLSTASKLAPVVNSANALDLFEKCRGRSKSEIDEVLVEYKPRPVFKPVIKEQTINTIFDQGVEVSESAPKAEQQPISKGKIGTKNTTIFQAATTSHFNIKFGATIELKKKIERLAQLWNLDPIRDLDKVMDRAINAAAKVEVANQEKIKEAKVKQKKENPNKTAIGPKIIRRHIPVPTRKEVFRRADHQCEFVGSDGRRCKAKHGLEIDHLRPWGMGGGHELENLRICCMCRTQSTHLPFQ